MTRTPKELRAQTQELLEELGSIGEFRRGSVGTHFHKCGKQNCVCQKPGHPGHAQTKLTLKEGDKTHSTHLGSAAAIRMVTEQTRNHDCFVQWCRKWTALNEQISEARLQEALSGEEQGEQGAKKKLLRPSLRRSTGR